MMRQPNVCLRPPPLSDSLTLLPWSISSSYSDLLSISRACETGQCFGQKIKEKRWLKEREDPEVIFCVLSLFLFLSFSFFFLLCGTLSFTLRRRSRSFFFFFFFFLLFSVFFFYLVSPVVERRSCKHPKGKSVLLLLLLLRRISA